MIDKPKGGAEYFIDQGLHTLREVSEDVREVLAAGYAPVQTVKNNHPKLTKLVTTVACLTACFLLIVGYATPRTVTVNVDDSLTTVTTTYETTTKRVDSFLETHGIDYVPEEDLIDAELYDGISDDMVINVTKAFDVFLEVDGEKLTYHTLPGMTAADLIKVLKVTVGQDDIVSCDLDKKLLKGDKVIVKRVTFENVVEEEETDFDEVTKADSSMQIGKVQVTQKGRKGKTEKTYKVMYVDGKEVEKTLVSSEVIKKKRDKIVSYGTKITSGKPSKYEEKITGVRAYSYYYSGNPHGAYGLKCEYGTCAVDKDLIPLGSLLYIQGYGYAIANDVGSGIKGKTVDVYMEKSIQCNIWGARNVNVYIIRSGPE